MRYPVSMTVNNLLQQSSLTKAQFVTLIGYKNINGGIKTLNKCLHDGYTDNFFINALV